MINLLLLLSLTTITCPGDITRYADSGQKYATIEIVPAVSNDGSPVVGVRSDSLLLTDPYPIGGTGITWSAGGVSCGQLVMVMARGTAQRRVRRHD